MTPVASWQPADYHRAFDRCRTAWEKTSPQLVIDGWADMLDGLDREQNECRLLPVEPAADSPQTPPAAGSPVAGEPSRTSPDGGGSRVRPAAADAGVKTASSPAYSTTTPRPAEPGWGLRGSGQEGA